MLRFDQINYLLGELTYAHGWQLVGHGQVEVAEEEGLDVGVEEEVGGKVPDVAEAHGGHCGQPLVLHVVAGGEEVAENVLGLALERVGSGRLEAVDMEIMDSFELILIWKIYQI